MQTEFEFFLPRGFVDASGETHHHGHMRLAKALDEVESLQDPRVRANEAYLPIVLLSRVVTRLGSLETVTPGVVESLFAADLAYLEDLYERLNSPNQIVMGAVCPHCQQQFQLEVAPLG